MEFTFDANEGLPAGAAKELRTKGTILEVFSAIGWISLAKNSHLMSKDFTHSQKYRISTKS